MPKAKMLKVSSEGGQRELDRPKNYHRLKTTMIRLEKNMYEKLGLPQKHIESLTI